jgi:hypothetical protein
MWEDALARSLSDGLNDNERQELDSHLLECDDCRQYLEALKADDRLLVELAAEADACSARIESAVLEVLRDEPLARSRIAFLPALLTPPRLAGFVTSAAAILLVAGLVVFTNGKSVYSDVVSALKEIKTMRATGEQTQPDGSVSTVLILYDRNLGTYMKSTRGDTYDIIIDNGRYEWRYHSGTTLAVRRASGHPRAIDIPAVVDEILTLEEFRVALENPPVGTDPVDGSLCRLYRGACGSPPVRYGVWIDERNLILKYEEVRETEDGRLQVVERCRFYYDEPIDPGPFQPDFGPGVKILEGDMAFRKQFDPAGAIFTQEVFGHDFAVHDLRRCEGGKIYMVASLQPTERTIEELGPVRVTKSGISHPYGSLQLASSWKRLENGSVRSYYTFQPLAELNHNGLTVIWALWYPVGDWPEMEQGLVYAAHIHSRNELKENLVAAGEKWYARTTFPPLPPPKEIITDREAYRLVFDQVAALEPVANNLRLILGHKPEDEPGPNGEQLWTEISNRPSRMEFEDCEAAWRKELDGREEERLEFDRKGVRK